jgi:hypothetical protein
MVVIECGLYIATEEFLEGTTLGNLEGETAKGGSEDGSFWVDAMLWLEVDQHPTNVVDALLVIGAQAGHEVLPARQERLECGRAIQDVERAGCRWL